MYCLDCLKNKYGYINEDSLDERNIAVKFRCNYLTECSEDNVYYYIPSTKLTTLELPPSHLTIVNPIIS